MEGDREPDDNGHVAASMARGEGDGGHYPGLFLAGFRDCTKETLKYLVDVERLPENDPIIIGLKRHLLTQQQLLNTSGNNNSETSTDLVTSSCSENHGQGSSSLMTDAESSNIDHPETFDRFDNGNQDCSIVLNSTSNEEYGPFESSSDQHSFESSINDASMDTSDDSHRSVVSHGLGLHTSSSPCMVTNQDVVRPILSEQIHGISVLPILPSVSKDVNLGLEGLDLAALAQNNPSIASITRELFELLQQEDDEDHVESDDTGSSECGNGPQTVV